MIVPFIEGWIEQWNAQVKGFMNTNLKEVPFTRGSEVDATGEPE